MDAEENIQKWVTSHSHYKNVNQVWGGGQSYAFKVFDEIRNEWIFVKIYWYSKYFKESSLAEPRILSSIFKKENKIRKHIAMLYDIAKVKIGDDEYVVLKMEYCGEVNIGEAINREEMSLSQIIRNCKNICEGLHFLHINRIVHGDIKPENIMHDGSNCKIIDFGSTRRIDESMETIRISSIRTLNYTPPEGLLEEKEWCFCSDIYQVGVVLYEMLCGRLNICKLPMKSRVVSKCEKDFGKSKSHFDDYEKSKLIEANMFAHMKAGTFFDCLNDPPFYIPEQLLKIAKKACSFDRSKRFHSCSEMRNQLANCNCPDWLKLGDDEYSIENWKGRDYRLYMKTFARKQPEWWLESCRTGTNKFIRHHDVNTINLALSIIKKPANKRST